MAIVEVREWRGMLGLFAVEYIPADTVITLYPSDPPKKGVSESNSEYVVKVDIPTAQFTALPVVRSKPGKKRVALTASMVKGTIDGGPIARAHRDPALINDSLEMVGVFNTETGEMEPHPLGDALGVYANQSLFANTVLYQADMTTARRQDPDLEKRICLLSAVDIEAGTQIFIDYGPDFPATWLSEPAQRLLAIARSIMEHTPDHSFYRVDRTPGIATYDIRFLSPVALGVYATTATVVALHPHGDAEHSLVPVEIPPASGGVLAVAISESPTGESAVAFTSAGARAPPADVRAWLESVGNPPSLWAVDAPITATATVERGEPPVGFMYICRNTFSDAAGRL
jgi:hypothetical protein